MQVLFFGALKLKRSMGKQDKNIIPAFNNRNTI